MSNTSTRPLYYLKFIEPSIVSKAGNVIPIMSNKIGIGRGEENEIRYGNDRPNISRSHCSLIYENGKVSVFPLHNETNSTFVNGKKVNHKSLINYGDKITIADAGPSLKVLNQNEKRHPNITAEIQLIDVGIAVLSLGGVVLLFLIISRMF